MSVILDTSILGLHYMRRLMFELEVNELQNLTKQYSYIHGYALQKKEVPGFSITPKMTPLIDLRQPSGDIFATFRKNTRNEIRKTESIPDLRFVREDPSRALSYRFYKFIKMKDGVIPDLARDFSQCRFFNAYLVNQLIVSISCYDNGRVLRLKHIVSVRKEPRFDPRIIGYATRRLIWDICQWGKEYDYQMLDLGGINYVESAKSGVTMFKESFGGSCIDMYVYRYETKVFRLLKRVLRLFKRHIE